MTTARTRKKRIGEMDYPLLFTATALILFGLAAVWATSLSDALYRSNTANPLQFIAAQIKWVLLGAMALAATYIVGYRSLAKISTYLMFAVLLLLVAVLIFGRSELGSARRIILFGLTVQPSEIAKPVMIIYLARWLASKGDRLKDKDSGTIPFVILVGVYIALILLQPNLSTAIILGLIAIFMFLMAGANVKSVGLILLVGGGLGLGLARIIPYMWDRVTGFFGSENEAGVQQALMRELTQSAGMFGHGLDEMQKQTQLAAGAHMDFIYAFVTYGFGVVTAVLIVTAYLYLGYRAVRIARRAPDELGMLIGAGIGFWLLLQALIHVGVNIGVLPITGMTLPFVSYGGSSLLACMIGVGILLSISSDAGRKETRKSAAYSYWGRNGRPRVSSAHRRGGAARSRARR